MSDLRPWMKMHPCVPNVAVLLWRRGEGRVEDGMRSGASNGHFAGKRRVWGKKRRGMSDKQYRVAGDVKVQGSLGGWTRDDG